MTGTDENPATAGDPWTGANPLDPSFKDDPYPALNALRESEPVNYVAPFRIWRLSRYADIVRLYKDTPAGNVGVDGSNPGRENDSKRGGFGDFMLEKEGKEHSRLRRLVVKAFTGKRIEAMRSDIQKVVDDLLESHLATGSMDWAKDLASLLPGTVTCRMLGVPLDDRDKFNEWTAARTNAFFAEILPPEVVAKAAAAAEALADYFEALIPERRKTPGDDLLSALIAVEEEGDHLTLHELVVQVIGLLVAGYETTIGLLGNGLRLLIRNPAELEKLRAHPELAETAVQECLRMEGPILFNWRILHADAEFAGKTIPAGAQVWAMMAAGNRDPRRFPDPDRLDITRTDVEHLSFGGGRHWCLGQQLARVETEVAFATLLRRTRRLALVAPEKVEWSPSFFRVPGSLPITFEAC